MSWVTGNEKNKKGNLIIKYDKGYKVCTFPTKTFVDVVVSFEYLPGWRK